MLKTDKYKLKQKCTGCGACYNICSNNAIIMQEDEEGFMYPEIIKEHCIDCNLCLNVCPVNQINDKTLNAQDCRAAAQGDNERIKSSSGAIFPLIAKKIILKGGFVAGVIFRDNEASFVLINDVDDIEGFRGSKYIQSKTGKIYRQIKEILENKTPVLFVGTPCQIAGLKSYLGEDIENLYLIDLVCHGVSNSRVYEKYIKELKPDAKNYYTNFRDKTCGWHNAKIINNIDGQIFSNNADKDFFMKGFLANLFLRKSCAECKYANIIREGDLTLGDFWGIEKYQKSLDDNKGVNLVLINNKKGRQLYNLIKNDLKIDKKVPLKYAIKGNPNLIRPSITNENREIFFKNLKTMSFGKNVEISQGKLIDCAIINFWYAANYGAVLTCYALQETLKQMGYSTKTVNYPVNNFEKNNEAKHFKKFARQYLNLTQKMYSYKYLIGLNKSVKNFITGSDQVFRGSYNSRDEIYYLGFVNKTNKKIAAAASFGINKPDGGFYSKMLAKVLIPLFDYVSVREKDGAELMKNYYKTNAAWILDPVFLYDGWHGLIKNSERKDKNYIAEYILDKNEKTGNYAKQVANILNKTILNLNDKDNVSPFDWLWLIKNSDFVLTDSFHGACFAIIFNKPFICFVNKQRGMSRFDTLAEAFNIKDRFIDEADDNLLKNLVEEKIDYKTVNEIINFEKERSLIWLKTAIEGKKKQKKISLGQFFILIVMILISGQKSLAYKIGQMFCRSRKTKYEKGFNKYYTNFIVLIKLLKNF